jgi:catechol 2,3-dioxygenase-like lactoylglutathione lyase family enzyme
MTVQAMDHYTVLTDDMAGSVAFYGKMLGLKPGPSPKVEVPVTWLYAGEQAVLHLVGRKPKSRSRATGRFDHVAFRCQGYAATKARLKRHGVGFTEQYLPQIGLRQIFMEGPEGVWVELIFTPEDAAKRRRKVA